MSNWDDFTISYSYRLGHEIIENIYLVCWGNYILPTLSMWCILLNLDVLIARFVTNIYQLSLELEWIVMSFLPRIICQNNVKWIFATQLHVFLYIKDQRTSYFIANIDKDITHSKTLILRAWLVAFRWQIWLKRKMLRYIKWLYFL